MRRPPRSGRSGSPETELAVLLVAGDDTTAQTEAAELVARAHEAGLDVRCGYAPLAPGWSSVELIAAAGAALAYAQRVGPGAIIG